MGITERHSVLEAEAPVGKRQGDSRKEKPTKYIWRGSAMIRPICTSTYMRFISLTIVFPRLMMTGCRKRSHCCSRMQTRVDLAHVARRLTVISEELIIYRR